MMFSKNKPTKRVDLGDGNWVELQYLSKGMKNSFKSDAADVYKYLEVELDENGKPKEGMKLPEGAIGKINGIQYRRMAAAIRAWSAADIPVTIEGVQELDEEIFDLIDNAITEMNELSAKEEKN
ncbi:MAG: hypothetical protein ACQEXQ_16340 [Bacillota bacterium]